MKKCKICGELMDIDNNRFVCYLCGYSCAVEGNAKPVSNNSDNALDLLNRIEKEKVELIEKKVLSVCKVYNQGSEYTSTGTGWRGDKLFIITNAHVVEDFEENGVPSKNKIICEYSDKLSLYSKQKQEMKIVYFDKVEDIAILTPVSSSIPLEVPVLSIASSLTRQGEMVFTIGNPLHYKFTYTEGSVANPQYEVSGSGRKYPVLQTTLTLNHGNSGGPVFNTKGDVVGMTTFNEMRASDRGQMEQALFGIAPELEAIAGYGFCVTSVVINNTINKLKKVR